jgi:hypothetical protein
MRSSRSGTLRLDHLRPLARFAWPVSLTSPGLFMPLGSLTPGNAAQVKQEQTRPHRDGRLPKPSCPPRARPDIQWL